MSGDLGSKFAPNTSGGRASGLGGLLQPRRTNTPDDSLAAPAQDQVAAAGSAGTAVEAVSTSSAVAAPRSGGASVARRSGRSVARRVRPAAQVQRVPVYVSEVVRRQLREATRDPQTPTYAAVAVEAFATHTGDSLQALFAEEVVTNGSGGIPRVVQESVVSGGGSEVQLHLRSDQLQWIEEQQRAAGVSSRSQFIATVLQNFLGDSESS